MRALVVALALLLLAPAAAAAQEPLKCDGVDLAPALASDRNPDGSRVQLSLDARGRYVPIVMVHGWTGQSTHNRGRSGAFSHLIDLTTTIGSTPPADRSLIGQLQRIPGAAVFTFDYHDFSARWVEDAELGPALGDAIDCLFEKTGEKVIVVGHSMGGLVTRFALTEPGAHRAERVSTVITFGTPETGSDVAALINNSLAANSDLEFIAMIRMILSVCGDLTTEKLTTGSLCDLLPTAARAFDSAAGRGLRTGSDELGRLPWFPAGVTLDALAGSTTIKTDRFGWFGSPWSNDVAMGDMIVSTPSALRRATLTKEAHCAYQLNAYRYGSDRIGLAIGQIADQDVAQPIWRVAGPCYHGNLMRTVSLTNEATGMVNEDIGGRTASGPQPPLTKEAVDDAQLPVCRDYVKMEGGEKDVVLRRMQEAHNDTMNRTIARVSVAAFCKLNPGRLIDGVYSPGSRAGGGSGSVPTCAEWREMNDAEGDAALERIAREHDDDTSIATLRLSVGGYCAVFKTRRIDGIY